MAHALLYGLGVVAFIGAILASIALHELGHLYFAKRFGVKVTQYFVGFGRTLWSRQRGETEYGIKAVPLGGYVRILGMLPPARQGDGDPTVIRDSNTGMLTGLAAAAKQNEYATIAEEDRHRLFYQLPWWKKFVVMAAGPSVNIALAFFCFLAVFATYGQQDVKPAPGAPVVAAVARCALPPYGASADSCSAANESPAWAAGLRKGDRIQTLNGQPLKDWQQFADAIQGNVGKPLHLGVERDGKNLELTATPRAFLRPSESVSGKTVTVGYMGVGPATVVHSHRAGPLEVARYMGERTKETATALVYIPGKVKNVFLSIMGVQERDPNGPVSILGGARFSGEVATAGPATTGSEVPVGDKVATLVMLVGSFNLFVGLFNFLPILPLDGGHMAGALWEGLRRGWARLWRRPLPGPVDISLMLPVAYAMGFMLFLMGLILIVGDVVSPIRLVG